jgi:serine/threonine protein kinase
MSLLPHHPDSPGSLINRRYRIQKLLGRGGFGQTYLAHDTQCFDHPCVLKEFAPASRAEYAMQKARELFEREARVLYSIQHAQIPKFLAWFVEGDRLFLVQEYVAGKTYAQLLRERQQQGGVFSEAEIITWLLDLLKVLQYLHQQQIVHRDISPDNLMLPDQPMQTGDRPRPVLIDFGLVKQTLSQIYALQPDATEPASFVGKFGYAPPEQIRLGQCAPSSDLYALAVTALVLLTGQDPRLLMNQESLDWHWQDYVSLSPALTQILSRMLQEKPRNRYQTAAEVIQMLQPLTASAAVHPAVVRSRLVVSAAELADLPSRLNPELLKQYQQELTRYIGPIAEFVLENALAQSPTAAPAELIDALALEISDSAQANAFRAALLALPSSVPSNRSDSRSSTLSNSSRLDTQNPTPVQKFLFPPDFLIRCKKALTHCIGPFADLVLEDVMLSSPQTPEELIDAIAAEIPTSKEAQTFRKLMQES